MQILADAANEAAKTNTTSAISVLLANISFVLSPERPRPQEYCKKRLEITRKLQCVFGECRIK